MLWIRIRIPNTDPDPGKPNKCGPMRIRIHNLVVGLLNDILPSESRYFFHDKIQLSAIVTRIRIRSNLPPWIRIWISTELKAGSAFKPIWNAEPFKMNTMDTNQVK
jgi:hypothetical protein